METKGVTCKIPLDLHQRASEEMREKGMTVSQYIELIILEHMNGVNPMAKGRTLAFQVSEDLYQRIKEHLARCEELYHRKFTQREFVLGLIEKALKEAEETFAPQEPQDSPFPQGGQTSTLKGEPAHVGAPWPPSGVLTE